MSEQVQMAQELSAQIQADFSDAPTYLDLLDLLACAGLKLERDTDGESSNAYAKAAWGR